MANEVKPHLLHVGQQIAEVRKAKKLSFAALEELTGINHSNLNRIERGILSPNVDTLCRIAKALDMTITIP